MNKFFRTRSSFLLTVIFIVSTALMFFLMAVTYKHLERQSENSDWMTDSYEVSVKLERIYSNLKDIETERRNFILTEDPTSDRKSTRLNSSHVKISYAVFCLKKKKKKKKSHK